MAKEKQAVLIPDYLTVRELADLIEASPIEVMKKLINNGIMASINQTIDYDTAAIVVEEFGFEAQSASAVAAMEEERRRREESTQKWRSIYENERPEDLKPRPPVVTILGHVDHGKTTLLDTIRSTRVAEGEAGGITQHIGAYRAQHQGQIITFLDTPGHEAFTAMRARGAQGADIAILVVAADDGVMPTTREAYQHARAANVPIVVAITKIDKSNANVELVKQQLAQMGLVPDEWDGDTLMVPVSAPQNEGIDDLLDAILLIAEDTEIVANPKGNPAGIVLEAEIDRSRGTLATLLVLNGTLKQGDVVVAGLTYGRIKAMFDEVGNQVKQAPPSTPVRVLGLSEPPQPGDIFEKVKNEKEARRIVAERQEEAASHSQSAHRAISLEDVFAQFQSGETKELTLIVKADVQGSLEPLVDQINRLSDDSSDGIKVNIIAADIGNIGESDVMLASASGAIVIGFNVDVDNAAQRAAEAHGVEIRLYRVIYKLLEDLELALQGMLEPEYAEKVIGSAVVRAVFHIRRAGNIAGCYVRDGIIRRNAKCRVIRGADVLAEGLSISSLKREKDDVREVRSGFECGVALDGFSEFEEGDVLEFYVMERAN
ncbi:MAG: translation initiation factor IF-2 [Chloroflexi bacterium]|nr:MAG: translation initiation factor IF-2 [Chloroflexota bacterium]